MRYRTVYTYSDAAILDYGLQCFEAGRQQGMAQEHALWELAASSQEIEAGPQWEPIETGPQWEPIETAPETGFFLVYEDGAQRVMHRYRGEWKIPEPRCMNPTHWLALPTRPKG